MQTGRRNCRRCTRWRPITDYGYSVYRPTTIHQTVYIRKVCIPCEKSRRRVLHETNKDTRDKKRKSARYYAYEKRRREGRQVRKVGKKNKGKYGAGRKVE